MPVSAGIGSFDRAAGSRAHFAERHRPVWSEIISETSRSTWGRSLVMAGRQWRPNYFCLLSFHQIIYSPVGPAEALNQAPAGPDRGPHETRPGGESLIWCCNWQTSKYDNAEHIKPITNTRGQMQNPACLLYCPKTNVSLAHNRKPSSLFSHSWRGFLCETAPFGGQCDNEKEDRQIGTWIE